MSDNKKMLKKAGHTVVVTSDNTLSDTLKDEVEVLPGCKNVSVVNNNTMFIVFDSTDNSKNGLKQLRVNHKDLKVKYSYYKLFFKMNGLNSDSDYDKVKEEHKKWVEDNCNCKVLYYKLYRKEDGYLGCGDLTVDTKDAVDKLLSFNDCKEYKLESGLSGLFYRFKKKAD